MLLATLLPGTPGASVSAFAQTAGPAMGAKAKVSSSASAGPAVGAPGDTLTAHVDLMIDDGWKMYAMDSPPPSRGVAIRFEDIPESLTLAGPVQQETPQRGYDPNFRKEVTYFENQAHVWADVAIAPDASPGEQIVSGAVEYMICNDDMCYPPVRQPFEVAFTVTDGPPGNPSAGIASTEPSGAEASGTAPSDVPSSASPTTSTDEPTASIAREPADAADGPDSDAPDSDTAEAKEAESGEAAGMSEETAPVAGESDGRQDATGRDASEEKVSSDPRSTSASATRALDDARADGFLGFLLLAIGAGAAALLTPCVFPMIPLTVSFFTKHSASRREAVKMAALYGFAIIATFTGLGVAMALILGAAGAQSVAANPWVNLFIGGTFVVFALSLLGLFELRLPSGLLNYFNQQGTTRSGIAGVLFMGLTLTLVSFSCTAPFVGGLLAATSGGAWFFPIAGMLAFSTTFAIPFVVFAMFPRALESLPSSGQWMNGVKVTLGFVELAAALKFLSNADLIWGTQILSRTLALALTIVIFALAGLYLLGKLRLAHEAAVESIGSLRLLAAMAFFGLSMYLLPGLFGASLGLADAYLPPRQASDPNLFAARTAPDGEEASEFDWYTDDIDAALRAGREAQKPVFVDFTGYTCTNCRDMEANVFPRNPVASQLRSDFVLLRLYTDDLPDGTEFQRYQLRLTGTTALPTYAVLDPKDEGVITKMSGTASVEEFAAFLQRGAAEFQDQRLADAAE
jgi:thiol:disulfide interchange protein